MNKNVTRMCNDTEENEQKKYPAQQSWRCNRSIPHLLKAYYWKHGSLCQNDAADYSASEVETGYLKLDCLGMGQCSSQSSP